MQTPKPRPRAALLKLRTRTAMNIISLQYRFDEHDYLRIFFEASCLPLQARHRVLSCLDPRV